MRKIALALALAVGFIGTVGTFEAMAGTVKLPFPNKPKISPKSTGGVTAPNAQIAGIIVPGSADPSFVLRSKGIQQVTNPFMGIYCIKPSPTLKINVNRIVPVTSQEFSSSTAPGSAVYLSDPAPLLASLGTSCPAKTIVFATVEPDGDLTNSVGFNLVIP